ncbi:MAG: TIGR03619 family F420-dependent LLM class oxidoreductase [Microthrixaceae bacterium]
MAGIVPDGALVWGMQLPVQSQSRAFVQPWEHRSGPRELARIAEAADRGGAFYVAVCDHVAIPRPHDDVMGAVWYDTVATLGWLAGRTEHVHLMSHVAVLPLRPAPVTAKAYATLDALSGGRVILGVGAGHLEEEFELLGQDFAGRGDDLDRVIATVRTAFATGEVRRSGTVARIEPMPSRPGGPPIWVGGSSARAMRRAVELGDGWLPQGPPKMGMRAAIDEMREARRATGAEPLDMGIQVEPLRIGDADFDLPPHTLVGEPDRIVERLRRYAVVGANHLQLRFAASGADDLVEQIERFSTQVWPSVA